MRSPSRIPGFCNRLNIVWALYYPDLRFGQLIEMVFNKIREDGKDPFYIEEDEMIRYLDKIEEE